MEEFFGIVQYRRLDIKAEAVDTWVSLCPLQCFFPCCQGRVGARNAALDFELKKLLRRNFPEKLLQIESFPL